ncbi:hypothetical protein BDZ89DRAFT_207482 [Hymenopellis radicata]|nr:hypothetical protein BDZ89DRAFT_207482 [Hymenopellis radicata]
MKETTLRDVAIGINYYDINPLYGRNTSRFDKCTLVDTICRAFKSISPVFSDLEPSLVGDPPATLPHDPPESNLSDQPKRKPQQQSHFVGLPTEIHQYIYSFFPDSLRSLANLAATCSRLREICTPLIYAEPFPAPTFTVKYPHHLRALSAALVDVLSSELHLASHIRRLSVRVEGILGYPPLQYPPLQLCLADMFTHLMEVNLYVPSECEDCVAKREGNESLDFTCRFKTTEAIAAVTRRWPNLSSFSLFSLGAGESHLDGAPTPSPTPAVLIPHNLEKLRISYTPVTPVSLATRKALMNASSHTLRHLVLHYERVAMDDLPVFPSLERLELATGLPIEDIRPLLQKSFSSVRFLSLDSTYDLPESPGITLDLSGIFDDLEHLSVSTSWLVLSRLIVPPSVVTVQVHYFYNGYPSLIVSGPLHLPCALLNSG